MRWSDIGHSSCSIARALAIVGDRWTMLILREAFFGVRRYEDFQRLTQASPRLVADRLGKLVAEGVLEKRLYRERPTRHEYRLTEKGRELHPVMVTLSLWGQRWMGDPARPPVTLRHRPDRGCGRPTRPVLVCRECGEPVGAHDIAVEFGEEYADERAALAGPAQQPGRPPPEGVDP
ncbi:winged helix-turn-helix transcriptional regulator [Stella sp.]|uniref:winged helix-turn-helix transcriptional regulator n=1 Tax=Stella sp. TaxID=2912054 RepID=UPI0035AE9EC5